MKLNAKLFFLFAFLVVIDQLSKYYSSQTICNPNIAWSFPIAPAIFYFVWIVIITFLIRMFLKTRKYYQKIFITLIFAGAISNIVDRARFGCVVDFIDLKFWPVFNLADAYITIGIILLIIFNFKFRN